MNGISLILSRSAWHSNIYRYTAGEIPAGAKFCLAESIRGKMQTDENFVFINSLWSFNAKLQKLESFNNSRVQYWLLNGSGCDVGSYNCISTIKQTKMTYCSFDQGANCCEVKMCTTL